MDDFERALQKAKRSSVGQLLFRAARLWNERAIERLREMRPALRPAHAQLLPHLDLEGTQLSLLAARIGITKQAVGELVDELEGQGLLERVADPRDRRAKLVRFTAEGRGALLAGLELLGGMEAELARALGPGRMRRLGETLERLVDHLEG